MKPIKWSLFLPLLIAGYLAWVYQTMSRLSFPYSTDMARWLTFALALLSEQGRYVLTDHSPFQYTPIPSAMLAALLSFLPESAALMFFAFVFLAVRVVCVFLLARHLLGNGPLSLIATVFDTTAVPYQELMGFSSYPNILAIAFLTLTLLLLLRHDATNKRGQLALSGLFAVAVAFTHDLTSLVLIIILVLYLMMSIFVVVPRKGASSILLVTVLAVGLFSLLGGYPNTTFNEAAFYLRPIGLQSFLTIFGFRSSWGILLLAGPILLALFALYTLFFKGKKSESIMLFGWLSVPFAFYLLTATKVTALDGYRVPYYVVTPLVLLTVYSLRLIGFSSHRNSWSNYNRLPQRMLKWAPRTISTLFIIGLVSYSAFGLLWAQSSINYYVSRWSKQNGSDAYASDIFQWVRTNTRSKDVFATKELTAFLLQGVAERRTLFWLPEEFLYTLPDYITSLETETILTASVLGQNAMFRLEDLSPVALQNTPSIQLYESGRYSPFAEFNDYELAIQFINGTLVLGASQFDGVLSRQGQFSYSITYTIRNVGTLVRTVNLTLDDVANVAYKFTSSKVDLMANVTIPLVLYRNVNTDGSNGFVTNDGRADLKTNAGLLKSMQNSTDSSTILLLSWRVTQSAYFVFHAQNTRIRAPINVMYLSNELVSQLQVRYALISNDDAVTKSWIEAQPNSWTLSYKNLIFSVYLRTT